MPKLSPLQPRIYPSMIVTGLVALIYLSIFAGHCAYAAELDSILPEDHNHERLLSPYVLAGGVEEVEGGDLLYESQFPGAGPELVGRQVPMAYEIPNNIARKYNVEQGATAYFVFLNESVWAPKAPTGSGSTGLPSTGLIRVREEGGQEGDQGASNILGEDDSEGSSIHRRANDTRTVYITLNTCIQPSDPKDVSSSKGAPPQVTLYVAENQTALGPGQPADAQQIVKAENGFANLTFEATTQFFMAVSAPNTTDFEGIYNVEVGASIDAPYHAYSGDAADLFFIDSDSNSALLATKNLTLDSPDTEVYKKWMQLDPPPYVIFANNKNQTWITGVSHSYCGLETYAQIAGTKDGLRTNTVRTSMTNVTLGNYPKQQFYFQGLNASSSYYGILAMPGNSTPLAPGGGGRIWQTMDFTTQSDGNCAVLFNLSFCSDVSYAVPGNPKTFPSVTDLAAFYDNAAAAAYANFDKALQQIPCEIPSTGQYSLVRTCADCAKAYKAWLCSVTIPRCQDYSSADPWLQPRNVVQAFPNASVLDDRAFVAASQQVLHLNSSRNPAIDEVVKPGPYKEILPCLDMCYNLVQSCPAAMGFACPGPGGGGFASSYGLRPNGSANEDGQITCNYPGAAYHLSGARRVVLGGWGWMWVVVVAGVGGLVL